MDDRTKYLLIIPIVLILVFSFYYYKSRFFLNSVNEINQINTDRSLKSFVKMNGNKIFVELALTDTEKDRGLSYRQSLPEDRGMLFVFEDNSQPMFWMKGMNFALDILWISQNRIVAIDKNIPSPEAETPDTEIPIYSPPQGIDYVLEINAGTSDKLGIEVNNPIEITFR